MLEKSAMFFPESGNRRMLRERDMKWILAAGVACLNVICTSAETRVVAYPAPEDEQLSEVYRVQVNGIEVPVYQQRVLDPPFAGKYNHGGTYAFAVFDCNGPVTLKVATSRALENTVVRPVSSKTVHKLTKGGLTLNLKGPCKLSVEPDGKNGPLLLFANPIETNIPSPGDANVVYFGPGIHKPERIPLKSGQTLYLAGGAIVKGSIQATGENITIRGRGILDGNDWEWRKGPGQMVSLLECRNVRLEDIVLRGAWGWTVVPKGSSNIQIKNLKICNSRVQNDDGINPCNSQDILISDCFIRSDDDCIALKGLDYKWVNNNVEGITVENTILWCDRARIFLMGHESRAEYMRNIGISNLDIIHFSMTPFLLEPGEDMHLTNVEFSNIRINGEGQKSLIRLKPVINRYMRKQTPGLISNIMFKDVELNGIDGEYLIELIGHDADHTVDGIQFKNVVKLGKPVTKQDESVRIGPHVKGISFKPSDTLHVTAVPPGLKLEPFYKKHVSANGYPIVGSGAVPDYALLEAGYLVNMMLAKRPDVRDAMVAGGSRLIVMGINEFTTDIPEHSHLSPKDFWDRRARGLGGSRRDPVCSCAEENLLGYKGDPYHAECILIHEFAHNIHLRGVVEVDPTFDGRLKAAYDAAMEKGLWLDKYASQNHHEYFAEGVQSWFDNNRPPDHDHNHVDTRQELIEYDPALAALCREVFGDTELKYSKPATRLTGHMAGYDPSTAPTFQWPERLAAKREEIRQDSLNKRRQKQKELNQN
jgi:hypothetical protein